MSTLTRNPATAKPGKGKKDPHKADKAAAMDIRDPDALQETLLGGWAWVEANAIWLGAILVVGIVILSGMSISKWWQGRIEHQAQEAYYPVEARYNKLKEGFDKAKMKAMMPSLAPKDAKDDAGTPATGDLEKDYGSVMGDLEKFAHEHAGTTAGAQAAILAADTYMNYGKADKAAEISQFAMKNTSDKTLVGALTRVQYGSALATKGDCKEAVKVWGQVLSNKAASYLYADVSLRAGLCYEQLGDTQKAAEMYQKVGAEAGPDSSSASTAKGLLRAIELKTKPAAPAAPAAGRSQPTAKKG